MEKVNKFVGKPLELDTIGNILTNLEILIKPYGPNALLVTPPSHRADLTRPADIYEEIIRMYGFDNIEDRKSTRLNSSHANISYAVFCLKKKKNNSNLISLSIKSCL